jgi:hypothetical protein
MARDKVQSARTLVAQNVDPSEDRNVQKRATEADEQKSFSFIARRLGAKNKKEGRAEATLSKMVWILSKVENDLGSRAITEITTPHVMAALRNEEDVDNLETARRMRTVIGEVFRYAIQNGICTP